MFYNTNMVDGSTIDRRRFVSSSTFLVMNTSSITIQYWHGDHTSIWHQPWCSVTKLSSANIPKSWGLNNNVSKIYNSLGSILFPKRGIVRTGAIWSTPKNPSVDFSRSCHPNQGQDISAGHIKNNLHVTYSLTICQRYML